MVSHTFSALYVYSKFGHHLHPLRYLCAKFRLFRHLHCWASPRKRNHVLNQSPTQLIWCPGNRSACASENKVLKSWHWKHHHSSSLASKSMLNRWLLTSSSSGTQFKRAVGHGFRLGAFNRNNYRFPRLLRTILCKSLVLMSRVKLVE